jgi:hypothetical protein
MNFANRLGYTDVNPCEIVKTISDKTLEIREMNAEQDLSWNPVWHPGGFFAHCSNQRDQKWTITSNENNPVIRIRLSKNNGWQDKYGQRYGIADAPRKFYDYNF